MTLIFFQLVKREGLLIFNLFEKVTPQSGQVYGDSAGGYGAPSDSYGGGGGGGGVSYGAPSSSYDARSSYDYRTVGCQIFNCQQSRCLGLRCPSFTYSHLSETCCSPSRTMKRGIQCSRFPCCVPLALSWNTNENENPSTDKLSTALN